MNETGFQKGITGSRMMLLNIVTTIGLGILFRLFLPCVLLNLSFIPIRISAGGHHADSPVKCYVLSTLLIAALLAILKWVSVSLLAAWILILAASAVLLWLAPIETENNPLDETEVRVYRESETALETLCLSEGRTLFRRESRVALVQMSARRCGNFSRKKR